MSYELFLLLGTMGKTNHEDMKGKKGKYSNSVEKQIV